MNRNIWELYKNSERGKEAIELFNFDIGDTEQKVKYIFRKYNEYFGGLDLEDYFIDNFILIAQNIIENEIFLETDETASDYFTKVIDNLEIYLDEDNTPIIAKQDYKTYNAILSEISLVLYAY